jgi:hypothetical protein
MLLHQSPWRLPRLRYGAKDPVRTRSPGVNIEQPADLVDVPPFHPADRVRTAGSDH